MRRKLKKGIVSLTNVSCVVGSDSNVGVKGRTVVSSEEGGVRREKEEEGEARTYNSTSVLCSLEEEGGGKGEGGFLFFNVFQGEFRIDKDGVRFRFWFGF